MTAAVVGPYLLVTIVRGREVFGFGIVDIAVEEVGEAGEDETVGEDVE